MMKKFKRFAAVISAAVMMAVGCATGTYKQAKAASGNDYTLMIKEMSVLINEARAEEGMKPLQLVPYLNEVAELRTGEAVEKFSHTRPNGSKFSSAVDYDKVPYAKVGENLAAGFGTAVETLDQWKNSPAHWAAIMNPNYTHIGIGVCYDPNSYYTWYWTAIFVKIDADLEGQHIVTRTDLIPKLRMAGFDSITPQCYGDVNGDGFVNSFDCIALTKYVLDEMELNERQIVSCDVMNDGSINVADIITLHNYIMGICPSIPVAPGQ